MPRRWLGEDDVQLLLILNPGTREGWVVSVMPQMRFSPPPPHTDYRKEDEDVGLPVSTYIYKAKNFSTSKEGYTLW